MVTKLAACKFCGVEVEWWEYGRPPRNPTTKELHKCASKTTTASTDSSNSNQSATTAVSNLQSAVNSFEKPTVDTNDTSRIEDWLRLVHEEIINVKRDLDLNLRYNRGTMMALNFLCSEMEKKKVIDSLDDAKKKSIFTDPIEEMEGRLRNRNADPNTKD